MAANPEPFPERAHSELPSNEPLSYFPMLCEAAFVERLPFALTYTANLEPNDHAVLFYDNLVVAAEYLCAFIEEGIRRQEVTCFTGLEPTRYRTLFEQVGIRVAELETCGYLRNLSTDDFYHEMEQLNDNAPERNCDKLLRVGPDVSPGGIRFIHVQESRSKENNLVKALMERERRTHKLASFPTTSICCYDAKPVLEEASSDCFKELLKAHNHCFFQGIAMPTSRLLGLQTNAVYPKIRSP